MNSLWYTLITAHKRVVRRLTILLFSGRSSSLGGGGCVSLGFGAGAGAGSSSSSTSEKFRPSSTERVVITRGSCSFLHNGHANKLKNVLTQDSVFDCWELKRIWTNRYYVFRHSHTCQVPRVCSWAPPAVLCSWDLTRAYVFEDHSPTFDTSWAWRKDSSLFSLGKKQRAFISASIIKALVHFQACR